MIYHVPGSQIVGKTGKKSWRGGKKEKERNKAPVIISFTPPPPPPSPLLVLCCFSPQFLPVFFYLLMFALSKLSGPNSRSLEQAKYDRPGEALFLCLLYQIDNSLGNPQDTPASGKRIKGFQ